MGFLLGVSSSTVGAEEAEERPSVEIGWTTNPPEIDGHLDPDEWADAGHVDGLTQATPDPGEAPTQRTEIWLMTDGDHLYIAARLWDTNPEEIIAHAMQRDANTTLDDRFGFTIDPFFDRQNGYFFQVNPNGARRDALLEGNGFASDWDGRWYAKTSIDEKGWIVEIALPFATINFNPKTDVWGLNMARGIRRRNEIDRWADPVQERFLTAMGRAGNLNGMTGISQGLGLQIVPSGTLRRVDDANDPVDSNDQRHYTRGDASLDTFFKPIPSVTTALTVNTDFAESEVDDRRVNLSRFELFFPEKRDFFLQEFNRHQDYSEATALKIDTEIKHVVVEQYVRATRLLTENRDALHRVAEALLEHEVLDAHQMKQLMAGEPLEKKLAESAPPPPVREARDEEGKQGMGGLLPPPVAAPKPTS